MRANADYVELDSTQETFISHAHIADNNDGNELYLGGLGVDSEWNVLLDFSIDDAGGLQCGRKLLWSRSVGSPSPPSLNLADAP